MIPLVTNGHSKRYGLGTVELEIGADAAADFADYVRWVEMSEGMSTADARAATVEFPLRAVFKRDRLWHEWRQKAAAADVSRQPRTVLASKDGA